MTSREFFKEQRNTSSSAAAEVNGFLHRNFRKLCESPVGQFRMPGIHSGDHQPAEFPLRLSCLIEILLQESHGNPPDLPLQFRMQDCIIYPNRLFTTSNLG